MTVNLQDAVLDRPAAGQEIGLPTGAGLLGAADHAEGARQWLALLARGNHAELQRSFRAVDGQKVAYLSFGVGQVAELLSASATGRLEATFLLRPDVAGEPRFTVALHATDRRGRRVSSYYLPREYSTAVAAPGAPPAPQPQAGPLVENEVPGALAQLWLRNWAGCEVSAAQFATPYGPLEGYSIAPADFLAPLFHLTAFGPEELRLYLVLHAYHHSVSENTDAPAQTVGLMSRLWAPTGCFGDFQDMSSPMPPGHNGSDGGYD